MQDHHHSDGSCNESKCPDRDQKDVESPQIALTDAVVEKSAVFEERCGGTLPTAGMEDMDMAPGLAGKH